MRQPLSSIISVYIFFIVVSVFSSCLVGSTTHFALATETHSATKIECEATLSDVKQTGHFFLEVNDDVQKALKVRLKALGIKNSVAKDILEFAKAPEQRKYYDWSLLPVLFPHLPANTKPSSDLLAETIWQEYQTISWQEAQEEEANRPKTLAGKIFKLLHFTGKHSVKTSVRISRGLWGMLLAGISVAIVTPVLLPVTAKIQTYAFQHTPTIFSSTTNGTSSTAPAYQPRQRPIPVDGGSDESLSQTNTSVTPIGTNIGEEAFHDLFFQSWASANSNIPLNEREGRSIYYEVFYLTNQWVLIQMQLDSQRPSADTPSEQRVMWTNRQAYCIWGMNSMKGAFPDFYQTTQGRLYLNTLNIQIETATKSLCRSGENDHPGYRLYCTNR